MKKVLVLVLIMVGMVFLVACGGNSADENTNTQENNMLNNTDGNVENTENESSSNQNVEISIASAEDTSTIMITGAFAEYFAQKTDYEGIHFVVQLENETGAFADLRLDVNHAWFFYYSEGGEETVKGTFTEKSITFLYSNTLFDIEDVTSISIYIAEGDGFPERYECIPISDVSVVDEATQQMATDEYGIVGVYMDVFSDSCNILEMYTDSFGYVAKLNGTDYALTTNEQDSGDYIAYIGTSVNGDRCCINILDDKILSISEYYGEPELRYTLEFTPLYSTEFYGYDKDLNSIENPVKYEFDGTNMQITIDDTYTTGWVSLEEIKGNSGTLSFLQLYDIPMTSFEDDEVYFLDLRAFPKLDYLYQEMDIQLFTVYKSYFIEGDYYPNSAIISETFIANIETDQATQAKINDILGTYIGIESVYGKSDESHTFEIRENELLLDDKLIANINMEELYATLLLGHSILIYDGDEPTDVLTLYLNGEYIDIEMQEYGTTSDLENSLVAPVNYQAPSLAITVQKQ
ncbi:MAG: hypothetical protein R3Y24_08720 [Eubacteriales bacterium]